MNELETWKKLSRILESHSESRIENFYSLGITQSEFDYFESLIEQASVKNGWFTMENIRFALRQISYWMNSEEFSQSYQQYFSDQQSSVKVAVIMAGNIPLVGIHDFLSVLLSGCSVICKMSKEDDVLLKGISHYIEILNPILAERISFSDRKLGDFHAIIATGSDTSNQAFKTYFGKNYHLFRGHRTSIAVLDGEEQEEELEELGQDIFKYFGRGCRNVTHLCLPEGYDLQKIFKSLLKFSDVIQNKKYGNNYDYNKAVFLMNQQNILDNNFILLRESKEIFAPLAVLNYHFYRSQSDLDEFISLNKEKIQCIVGNQYLAFGQAQCPSFMNFADDINTFEWIKGIQH